MRRVHLLHAHLLGTKNYTVEFNTRLNEPLLYSSSTNNVSCAYAVLGCSGWFAFVLSPAFDWSLPGFKCRSQEEIKLMNVKQTTKQNSRLLQFLNCMAKTCVTPHTTTRFIMTDQYRISLHKIRPAWSCQLKTGSSILQHHDKYQMLLFITEYLQLLLTFLRTRCIILIILMTIFYSYKTKKAH